MPPSVVCRGCGRRLKLPPGSAGKKARCPKCGAKFDPAAADPEATAYIPNLAREPVRPEPPALLPGLASKVNPAPKPEPLSLDDAEPVLSLDDAEPLGGPPAPVPPPPARFAVEVVADSARKLRGPFAVVLTPHGLFLESVPARPFLFAPVGTPATSASRELTLTLPDRVLALRFGGANPRQLAADAAAFLAGTRPVPDSDDYRRPWWLLGLGAVLALGLAAVPVVLTQTSDLPPGLGLMLGGLFAAVALAANAGVALLAPLPTGGKVGAMAGVCVGVLAVFLVVLGLTAPAAPQPVVNQPEPAATPGANAPGWPQPGATPQAAEPEPPSRPPSHLDVAAKAGMSRLDDGPADVTAIGLSPRDDTVVIGYADGQTRLWSPDQPTFEPLTPGPRGDGPVRRVQFDGAGRTLYLTCPGGLIAVARDGRNRTPVKIPGDPIAVFTDAARDRFVAVRGGRAVQRYVPAELVRNPPAGRVVKGFVVSAAKGDEVIPIGVKGDPALPGPPTFVAWHPSGKVLAGQANGTIVSPAGLKPETVTRVHKAAVRAWATAAGTWDFATGDDGGLIAVWPNRSLTPRTFGDGAAAVTHLAFDTWGERLAVADADGGLWVWDAVGREPLFSVRRPAATALAFVGDDFLLIGAGKGVEVWAVAALAKRPR